MEEFYAIDIENLSFFHLYLENKIQILKVVFSYMFLKLLYWSFLINLESHLTILPNFKELKFISLILGNFPAIF